MNDRLIGGIVAVALAIVGVAIIAALVSPRAQTGNVLTSGAQAIGRALCTALSPITGGNCGNLIPSVNSTISFGIPPIFPPSSGPAPV